MSLHILADLFFDCLLDGWVIPGKSEHASSIGMALASVLSTRLTMESEDEGLREFCEHLLSRVRWERLSEPMFSLVVAVFKLISCGPNDSRMGWELLQILPNRLSAAHRHWLSRIILQTFWRWRCIRGPAGALYLYAMEPMCRIFAAGGDQMPKVVKTNFFLILAISLGLQIDIRDLYAPNDKCVTS